MRVLSIDRIIELAKVVVYELNEPLFIWGPPGGGKTEAMLALAESQRAQHVDIRLGQYGEVDLRGIPSLTQHVSMAQFSKWFPPETLPVVGNDLFPDDVPIQMTFDEMNQAMQGVSGIAYQIIQERRVGEHKFKPNVHMVAMGNRETDRGVANRQPLPLSNRFTHVEVGIDVDEWCYWAQRKGLPAIGVAFMQFRKPLLSTFDPSKTDKAFATPRSWAKALKYYEHPMPDDIKLAAISGTIGEGPAMEFQTFVDVWQKIPKMSDIMARPDKIELPSEPSMKYAVTVAVSGALEKNTTMKPLYTYLKRMDPELTILGMQLALQRDKGLAMTPEFIDFAKQYKAVFQP